MRAAFLAASLTALMLVAPPAIADGRPDSDAAAKLKQKLLGVRERIQDVQDRIKIHEAELARVEHGSEHAPSAPHSERLGHLETRIAEAETELVEMRTARRYTEHHPSVKGAVEVLEELRRMHRAELALANREAARHQSHQVAQHADLRNRVAALRTQLEQLTAMEQDLVAAVKNPKAQKKPEGAKKPKVQKPPMAGRIAAPGRRAAPGVEERLDRLEKAVKELVSIVRERRQGEGLRAAERVRREAAARLGRDGRPGRGARGGGVREGDGGAARERLAGLEQALEAERREAAGLREIIEQLEERVRGEREEAQELREMVRRMKDGRSGEQNEMRRVVHDLEKRLVAEREEAEELRHVVEELEERLHGEREEAEELRRMLRRMKDRPEHGEREGHDRRERAEEGDEHELRGHVRGLERRLKEEQQANRKLRAAVEELELKLKALNKKLKGR